MGKKLTNSKNRLEFDVEKYSLDSSVLIAFFNTKNELILKEVFRDKIYLSTEINKEVSQYDLSCLNIKGILRVITEEESAYLFELSRKHMSLSSADTHLITICFFNDLVCVSFEKKIRKVCAEEKIKNIGLLQILTEAIRLKLLGAKEAKKIVINLKVNGTYLSESIIKEIFRNL